MTFPTLAKTWQFIPNYAITATGTPLGTNRTILKQLKDAFTTTANWVNSSNASITPSNMWTTRYSCNSTVAGSAGDGVDRWSAITDLVFANAGSAHSWYVFRHTAIDTNCELLLSCEGLASNAQNITLVLSPSAGFTGGTTTARPTATDEIVVINNTTWGGVVNTDTNVKLHIMKSSDGQCWRFFVANGGQINTAILVEKAAALHGSWTHQAVALGLGTSGATNILTQGNLNTTASINGRGASNMTMYLAGPGANNALLNAAITTPNDLSLEWPFLSQQLYSITASNRGVHGYLQDIWYGSTTTVSGSTCPTTGTQHQFVQFGSLLLPWCQVAAQMT